MRSSICLACAQETQWIVPLTLRQVPEDKDYKDYLNPDSLTLGTGLAEPALLEDASGIAVQFERTGYYVKDSDSTPEEPVFNKTTSLKDSYKPE